MGSDTRHHQGRDQAGGLCSLLDETNLKKNPVADLTGLGLWCTMGA